MSGEDNKGISGNAPSKDISREIENFYSRKWTRHTGFWRDFYKEHSVLKLDVLVKRHKLMDELSKGCSSVLDIGCGVGDLLRDVGHRGLRVGIDMSDTNLRISRKNLECEKDVFFLMADGCLLPFADKTFDAVYFADVIEHIPDYSDAIREIHRVLKPGSRCICVTPNGGAIRFFALLDRIVYGFYFTIKRGNRPNPLREVYYEQFLPRGVLRNAFKDAGFTVERHTKDIFYPGTESTGFIPHILIKLHRTSRPLFRMSVFLLRRFATVMEPLRFLNFKQVLVAKKPD